MTTAENGIIIARLRLYFKVLLEESDAGQRSDQGELAYFCQIFCDFKILLLKKIGPRQK